jgi:hypothetical protein
LQFLVEEHDSSSPVDALGESWQEKLDEFPEEQDQ